MKPFTIPVGINAHRTLEEDDIRRLQRALLANSHIPPLEKGLMDAILSAIATSRLIADGASMIPMMQPFTEEDVRACFDDFIKDRMPLRNGDNTMRFRTGFERDGKLYRQKLDITVRVDESEISRPETPLNPIDHEQSR